MEHLIPSKDMREYFEKIGFTFTDSQKATLIWNRAGWSKSAKYEALRELAASTEDEDLKQQICERLQNEEKMWAEFTDNRDRRYIYVVTDVHDDCQEGYFQSFEAAKRFVLKSGDRKWIQKYPVIQSDELEGYQGWWVAEIELDPLGEVFTIQSNELPKYEAKWNTEYDVKRFEFQFISIPFDLPHGTIVRDVTTGEVGVLANGKEHWDSYVKLLENTNSDYWDVQVIVQCLTEKGYWSHRHINPLHLEAVELEAYGQIELKMENEEDKEKNHSIRKYLAKTQAEEALSLWFKSDEDSKLEKKVLRFSRKYADICKEGEKIANCIYTAKTIKDILW